MTVLAASRDMTRSQGHLINYGVIASDAIWEGGLCTMTMGHATKMGYAGPAVDEFAAKFLGVANESVDNSSGAAGALTVDIWKTGVFRFEYNGTPDASLIGEKAYLVDDQTVGLSGTGSSDFQIWVGEIVGIAGTAATSDVYVRIDNAVDQFPDYFQYVVFDAATITRGDLVCENAAGEAITGGDTASYQFLGVCIETVVNTDDGLYVKTVPFGLVAELTFSVGTADISKWTAATIGDPCYVNGSQAVFTSACTANVDAYVGHIVRKGATTTVFVNINATGEAASG